MNLSQEQENYIGQFLGQVNDKLGALPASERAHYLAKVRHRIYAEIRQRQPEGAAAVRNRDVADAIKHSRQVLAPLYAERKAVATKDRTPEAEARNESAMDIPELPDAAEPARGAATIPESDVAEPEAAVAEPEAAVAEPEPAEAEKEVKVERPAVDERRWLGVCLHLARRTRLSPKVLRAVFFVLGLVTGPAAVVIYLAAYTELYALSRFGKAYPVDGYKLVRRLLVAAIGFTGVYAASYGIVVAAHYLHFRYLHEPLESAAGWAWLEHYTTEFYLTALIVFIPFAMLSGLPMANAWDETANRIVKAGLSLYGLLVAIGVAFYAAGVLLMLASRIL